MDAEYRNARALRRKLEKTWKRTRVEEDRVKFVAQRDVCAQMVTSKREAYYASMISKADNRQKELFKIVNTALDNNVETVLPTHNDPVELANEFNEFYVDKIDKLRQSIPDEVYNDLPTPPHFKGEKLWMFGPTSVEEVTAILNENGIKTSPEDPIPVSIFKKVYEITIPALVEMINKSLSEGCVQGIKHSVIDPLLKKYNLDPETKKNYRPVNNLIFFSKLIERIVLIRIDSHMISNNLQNDKQFGYKKNHSTETMMLGILNDLFLGFDEGKLIIMMFLDLSAAFDTIDIMKLLDILRNEIGIDGIALEWCKSFLTKRTQRVKIKDHYSDKLEVKYGTPQGSVLGPRFFDIYVRFQPKIFESCNFKSTAFADDSNGMKKFAITFQHKVLSEDVPNCLAKITKYMNLQWLKINPDKTEIVLFHPKHLTFKVIIGGVIISESDCIRFSDIVKNVGVFLDKYLKLDTHVNKTVSSCYKYIKDLYRARNFLSLKDTEILVNASVTSRLDYCNSLFVNMSESNFYKLQKVQNAAARLVLKKRRRESASDMLKQLHWLPIKLRCVFKTLLIMFKCVHNICSNNLSIEYKSYNCRPQDFLLLKTVPAKTKYGKRRFDYYGPRLWNLLPLSIRTEEKLDKFKCEVKTLLFQHPNTYSMSKL